MKKRFLISMLLAILIFSGSFMFTRNQIQTAAMANLSEEEKKLVREAPPIDLDNILILMVGVDEDEKPEEGSKGRTDTMMLLKANFKTGKIDILSLPRDSRVDIEGNLDKLNHAHAYGGMPLLLSTLQRNFGLKIDYYIKVSFSAVKELVDAIGGIYLDVPVPISVPTLHVDLKPGYQKLDGNEALMFVRYREGYPDGDIGRVHAQQYFMKEFIKQMLSAKNIINLPSLISGYYSHIETNLLMGQMIKMVPLASKLSSNATEMHTIPGKGAYIGDTSYYIINWEETSEMLNTYFKEYRFIQEDNSDQVIQESYEGPQYTEPQYTEPQYMEPPYTDNTQYYEENQNTQSWEGSEENE